MLVKQRRQSVFCFIPASTTRLVRFTTAQPPWTGWLKSKSAELPSPPLQQRRSGKGWISNMTNTASTSLIPRATLTSRLKLSVRCVFLMVQLLFSVQPQVLSRSQKPSGVRQINMVFRGFVSSIRWTAMVPTLFVW